MVKILVDERMTDITMVGTTKGDRKVLYMVVCTCTDSSPSKNITHQLYTTRGFQRLSSKDKVCTVALVIGERSGARQIPIP